MISKIKDDGKMYNELEKEDIEWLEYVREKGKLLEVFEKREEVDNTIIHNSANRVEIYYFKSDVIEDTELTVWIKFEDDKIIGFETY